MPIEVTAFDPDGEPRWHRSDDGALVRRRSTARRGRAAREWDRTVAPYVIGPDGEPTPTERLGQVIVAVLAATIAEAERNRAREVRMMLDGEWRLLWSAGDPVPTVDDFAGVSVRSRPGPAPTAAVMERRAKARRLRDEGGTWAEIAEVCGVSVAQARRDVARQ